MAKNYSKNSIKNYQTITVKNSEHFQLPNVKPDSLNSKMVSSKENKSRNFIVDILFIIFGISSWVDINGLWVELPEMIQVLPEHYSLASYIVVTSQLANIGPILYSTARRFYSQKVLEVPVIHMTLAIGIISCALLAVYWNKTSYIAGQLHSVPLLSLAFCLALMDCTSSVLYLPFMANFKEIYILSYLAGEGMSGLFPSLIALAQGVGHEECRNITIGNNSDMFSNETLLFTYAMQKFVKPARFSVTTFFIILTFMVVLSWIAFILLNVLSVPKNERVDVYHTSCTTSSIICDNFVKSENQRKSYSNATSLPSEKIVLKNDESITSIKYYILLFIQMYISFTHNVILALQTYSCLAYGNLSYHLSVVLSNMANPAFCFLAMGFVVKSLAFIIGLTVFVSLWAGYVLMTAVLNPYPPLVDKTIGSVLLVIAWILVIGIMAFTKASIASILRKTGGQSFLFWFGVVTQIGSAFGAVISVILIQYTHIFQDYKSCEVNS